MADQWTYDESSHRYRNARTGRYLSASSSVELRDDAVTRLQADAKDLSSRLASQDLTVQQWEAEMQRVVREANTLQYAFGRGGRNAMTDADRSALADLISTQNGYLRAFAQDVAAGHLSEAQISARGSLYLSSARQAYGQGQAAAWVVSLPAYPGDGSTACKANCACSWALKDTSGAVEATWALHSGESCPDCRNRAATWAPLVLEKPVSGRIARLYRAA